MYRRSTPLLFGMIVAVAMVAAPNVSLAQSKSSGGGIMNANEIAYRLAPKKAIRVNSKPEPSSINLPSVVFEFNSALLTDKARAQLRELGKALTMPAFKSSKFVIGGHTDSIGTEKYNQSLSQRRANTVVEFLATNFRFQREKLVPVGWGEKRPIPGSKPDDAANRRVEITNLGAGK